MKHHIYIIAFFSLVAALYGCDKDEAVDNSWKDLNYAFLDSLSTVYNVQQAGGVEIAEDDTLFKLKPQYEEDYPIYYKKIGRKDGYVGVGDYVKFNQTAVVYYKGKLIDGTVFDYTFSGEYPDPEIDHTYSFLVSGMQTGSSGVIYGWTEIAQVMRPAIKGDVEHKGDFFRVYIPSEQGYGSDGSGSIPGYSVLVFDINMVSVE